MKRWVVVLFIALAVILLLSPGIVGRLAERNLSDSFGWVDRENDEIVVTAEEYRRGWFTSEGRYRVELSDSGLAELFGDELPVAGDRPPALVIDTRIDHGLVPFTSLGREHGTLQPGLAVSVSTLALEYEDGDHVELPGRIYSSVGVSGDAVYRYVAEAGSRQLPDATTLTWEGADLSVTSDAARTRFAVAGRIEPLAVAGPHGESLRLGAIAIDATQDRTEFRLGVGDGRVDFESMTFNDASSGTQGGFSNFVVQGSSRIENGRISGRSALSIGQVVAEPFGTMELDMNVAVSDLDAERLIALVEAVDRARTAAIAGPADVEPEVASLVARGGRIQVERFAFRLPQGEFRGSVDLQVPPGDDAAFSWPSVMLAMTATLDVSIDAPLYDYMVSVAPDIATASAMGFINATGDTYDSKVAFAKGLLTINGAPLPIPLGMPE